jgi:hypothetical protein
MDVVFTGGAYDPLATAIRTFAIDPDDDLRRLRFPDVRR